MPPTSRAASRESQPRTGAPFAVGQTHDDAMSIPLTSTHVDTSLITSTSTSIGLGPVGASLA